MTVTNSSSRREFMDEVFAVLWPRAPHPARPWQRGGALSRRSGGRRYALLPSAGIPVVAVPLRPRRAAASVLANYKASARGLARVRLRALAAAARLGVLDLWPAQLVLPAQPADGPGSLEAHLAAVLGHPVVASVYTSKPRANRKPVLQLLDGEGRTFGYAKVGVGELTNGLVRAEAGALAAVEARSLGSLRSPALLYVGVWQGYTVIVQGALDVSASTAVPTGVLTAAMLEICRDGSPHLVAAATNEYVDGLGVRLDAVETPRGRWLRAALSAWVAGTEPGAQLELGAWHGDWTPWNMAYDGAVLSVWDWERYEPGVPTGYDALHWASQDVIMSRRETPKDAIESLLAAAPGLLEPFGIDVQAAERIALLYLLELGARYEGDGQEAAGARLGALETWLLPALADRLGLDVQLAGR